MKSFFVVAGICFFTIKGLAQEIKFSDEVISAQGKSLSIPLEFDGTAGNNYLVNEYAGKGAFAGKDMRYQFDLTSLLKVKAEPFMRKVSIIEQSNLVKGGRVSIKDREYIFFLNEKDNNPYPIYYQVTNAGNILKENKLGASAENSQVPIPTKKYEPQYSTRAFKFNKNYSGDRILLASASKLADKSHTTISVNEFDDDMNTTFNAEYTIPLLKWRHYKKMVTGKMYYDSYDAGQILDIIDDNLGYIYLLVQSADPENTDNENLFWLYQFKKSDKNYMKVFRKEIAVNMMPNTVKLNSSSSGTVYVLATGYESDKELKNDDKVNKYQVSSFGKDGTLDKIIIQRLSMDLLELFDGSNDRRQKKDEYILGLNLEDFFQNSDGSFYLVWEQEVKTSVVANNHANYYTYSGNVLVQYFNKTKKMVWQKPVYKMQESEDIYPLRYSGIRTFHDGHKLIMFYSDEAGNANRDIADSKIAKFTVAKFANKDLTGAFVLSFDSKGLEKRKYISWPKDKTNFAMNMFSLQRVSDTRFVGIVTKLKQGVLKFEESDYLMFSLEL